jgi:hypothetical protein
VHRELQDRPNCQQLAARLFNRQPQNPRLGGPI